MEIRCVDECVEPNSTTNDTTCTYNASDRTNKVNMSHNSQPESYCLSNHRKPVLICRAERTMPYIWVQYLFIRSAQSTSISQSSTCSLDLLTIVKGILCSLNLCVLANHLKLAIVGFAKSMCKSWLSQHELNNFRSENLLGNHGVWYGGHHIQSFAYFSMVGIYRMDDLCVVSFTLVPELYVAQTSWI